jgi:hypothetical protein
MADTGALSHLTPDAIFAQILDLNGNPVVFGDQQGPRLVRDGDGKLRVANNMWERPGLARTPGTLARSRTGLRREFLRSGTRLSDSSVGRPESGSGFPSTLSAPGMLCKDCPRLDDDEDYDDNLLGSPHSFGSRSIQNTPYSVFGSLRDIPTPTCAPTPSPRRVPRILQLRNQTHESLGHAVAPTTEQRMEVVNRPRISTRNTNQIITPTGVVPWSTPYRNPTSPMPSTATSSSWASVGSEIDLHPQVITMQAGPVRQVYVTGPKRKASGDSLRSGRPVFSSLSLGTGSTVEGSGGVDKEDGE